MINYEKNANNDWFYYKQNKTDELYSDKDIVEGMNEFSKKAILELIENKIQKVEFELTSADAKTTEKLESILAEKIKDKKANLIGASFIDLDGKITGIINIRVGDTHEQIRF
jgi:hypothetical protein